MRTHSQKSWGGKKLDSVQSTLWNPKRPMAIAISATCQASCSPSTDCVGFRQAGIDSNTPASHAVVRLGMRPIGLVV